jgi:signal transduction histidine kinase/tetratricopeptide (TPR) repeat protein
MRARIVLLFCLAVGIPSGILIWIGFASLGRERLLLEEEVMRGARQALDQASKNADEIIVRIERSLKAAIQDLPAEEKPRVKTITDRLLSLKARSPFVAHVFLFRLDGEILLPDLVRHPPSPIRVNAEDLAKFRRFLSEAEESARGDHNLDGAATLYEEAFRVFEEPNLKAILLNRLAKIFERQERRDQALQTYKEIVTALPASKDLSGLPIAPFAMARIAELNREAGRTEKASEALIELYRGVIEGTWPLPEHIRGFLLSKVHRDRLALRETGTIGPEQSRAMEEQFALLEAKGRFLGVFEMHGVPEISEGLRESRPEREVFFHLSRVILQRPYFFTAMRTEGDLIVGFQVDLEVLKTEIAARLREIAAGFDARITLLDRNGRPILSTGSGTGTSKFREEAPLGRHLGFWKVSVTLPREEKIRRIQRNAMLIYGGIVGIVVASLIVGLGLTLRALTREMRLAELKSDFVSNVSHELRTPLTSIRMLGEMLRDGGLPRDKEREYFEVIEKESRRLQSLIDNVLDFSRIEKGKKELQLRSEELSEVVREVVETFRYGAEKKGFDIRLSEPDEPLYARIDRGAVGQILLNILSNAVKYSGESRVVEVKLERIGNRARVAVRDRGIGISREDQKQLFTKFYRGRGVKHDPKGVGLGLLLARELARLHGGDIAVESEPGRGSTFAVRLPIETGTGNNRGISNGDDPDYRR